MSYQSVAARSSAVLVGPTDVTADCTSGAIKGAIIDNGTVQVGVNCEGHLNTPFAGDPLGIGFMGLRFIPTGAASTEPGCQCEGWGVANGAKSGPKVNTCAAGTEQGYADVSTDGVVNIVLESFVVSSTTAVSVVRINNGADLWRVTHDYHPIALTPNMYEVSVTIQNLSGAPKPTLYRRVMDWDIYPTPFNEFTTLNPGAASGTAKLYRMDNNGFNSANPCSFGTFGTTLEPGDLPAVDLGPADHGALFDFDFGTLAAAGAGSTVTFKTYYGATADEATADLNIALVAAENFSYGQPNVDNGDLTHGTPNTFIFAFSGVGTSAVFCGNNVVDAGEQCDDGNTTSCDGCDSNCRTSACGNAVVCAPEACDDGNTTAGDGCSATCELEALCGNNTIDTGEACDGSALGACQACNAPSDPQPCQCTVPVVCGDNNTDAPEQCDGTANTACPGPCRPPTDPHPCTCESGCGNGTLETGETCDPPLLPAGVNGNICRANCTVCGDGVPDAGEECDDGNSLQCDPVHPQKPLDDCNNICGRLVCKDPARIQLTDGLDNFKLHARLVPIAGGDIDFANSQFGLSLSVDGNMMYRVAVPAGAIKYRNGGRFTYKNPRARREGGVYSFRAVRMQETYRVTVVTYGDLGKTAEGMVTHLNVGTHEWTVTGDWNDTGSGWLLRK